MLAASDTTHVVSVCDEGVWGSSSPVVVRAYFSSDGGLDFQRALTSLPSAAFGPVASPAPGAVIAGAGGDLVGTFDGGRTWNVVNHQSHSEAWQQIGFTAPSQGVAIDNTGTLLMTFDGGHTWAPVTF